MKAPIKILIVEDDPIIAKDIQLLLQTENYQVIAIAHDGVTALDLIAIHQPNLILLDIHLGTGITGIEVAEIIQEKYKIPFIFLTSYSDEATLAAAVEQGPYGYLVKPFQDKTLLTTITLAVRNFEREQKATTFDYSHLIVILTEQEQRLTKALITGKSYKEIAQTFFISINTVKFHLKNIYLKMEVKGRAELLAKLIQ